MAEQMYFKNALADFVAETAYAGEVRHLYELGLSAEKIKEQLSFPVSLEKIKAVIQKYEEQKNSAGTEYEFIKDTDAFGRTSFRRVKKE